jgi:hypothetical protein
MNTMQNPYHEERAERWPELPYEAWKETYDPFSVKLGEQPSSDTR